MYDEENAFVSLLANKVIDLSNTLMFKKIILWFNHRNDIDWPYSSLVHIFL